MCKLLDTPLLPESRVKLVAIGEEYTDIIRALENIGIECFKIKRSKHLDFPIACHADCRIIQLNKNTFVVDESVYDSLESCLRDKLQKKAGFVNYLTNRAEAENVISVMNERIHSPYPDDIKLNAKVISNNILCNSKHISEHIKTFADMYSYNIVHTNQGYSACSTVLLNNHTILTDDPSVYDTCNQIEISSTILGKGQIKLDGYNYGFIGGCCGFIDKNLLAFTGRIDSIKDKNVIYELLKANNISYIELTDTEMYDIGGIIPIIESCD